MKADVFASRVAAERHGVITLEQALEVGLTQDQVDVRVRSGRWQRLHLGVYALAGAPRTWEQRVVAAVLRAGVGAVASHLCAAALHAYPDSVRDMIEVAAAPGTQPRIPGVRVHRPKLLPEHDVRVLDGIRVTSYARTLVDCTGRLSLGQIARALDAGLVRGDVTLWSVERSLSALGQAPGRHPSKLWTLIGERSTDAHAAESRPEIRITRVLASAGLPTPTLQHRVKVGGQRYRLDFAYPEHKVAIEYDGWDAHRSRTSFDADRKRDRLLQLDGWVVLRITSQTSDADIVDTVRAILPSPGLLRSRRTPTDLQQTERRKGGDQARWRSRSSR